jgi:hypothetical protein
MRVGILESKRVGSLPINKGDDAWRWFTQFGLRELVNDHEYETHFRELCGTGLILDRK